MRPTHGNQHGVTVRIDQLKELKLSSIMGAFTEGSAWTLVRKNDNEAVVERMGVGQLTTLDPEKVQVLKFQKVGKRLKEDQKSAAGRSHRSGTSYASTRVSERSMGSAVSGSMNKRGVRFGGVAKIDGKSKATMSSSNLFKLGTPSSGTAAGSPSGAVANFTASCNNLFKLGAPSAKVAPAGDPAPSAAAAAAE